MSRINVITYDEETGERESVGWFDPDTSTCFEQDRYWDGNNMVGVITRSQWVDECLYRTKGGRWVLNHDGHRYNNGGNDYRFLTGEEARDWLVRSVENDAAIEKYFGELEDERGPGRPEIGDPVNVRLGELLAKVDEAATSRGKSRAEMIRHLVGLGLESRLF